MIKNKTILPLVGMLSLLGCGVAPPHPTEPVVQVQRVEVPIVQPCGAAQSVGPPPTLPDTSSALHSAPNIAERVKLLMAGRVLRDTWITSAWHALTVCAAAP